MTRDGFVRSQTNRFSAAVRKLLSIKGEEHDISYGVHLEEERPEYSFLKNETLFGQFNSATGAAGTKALIGVTNPAGSAVLVVITSAFVYAGAAGVVIDTGWELNPYVAIGNASMKSLDTRRRTAAATTAQAVGGASAVVAASIIFQHTTLAANDIVDVLSKAGRISPIILAPGTTFVIWSDAVGVITISGTICGYERPLESGELQA